VRAPALPCDTLVGAQRIVVLGPRGVGKTTAAVQLGQFTGLPIIELDAHFWSHDLAPMPKDAWREVGRGLATSDRWITDGDRGPYGVLGPRLERADTVVILDLSVPRCAWRTLRRSRERADF
jgi:adenylate kinase family enzyme